MKHTPLLAAPLLLLLLTACSHLHSHPHPAPNYIRTELFLGLNRPDGSTVSDAEFQAFLDSTITPQFPQGLTLLSARGQWLSPNGQLYKEPSRLLILLYPCSDQKTVEPKIQLITHAYLKTFNQESILRTDTPTRTTFLP